MASDHATLIGSVVVMRFTPFCAVRSVPLTVIAFHKMLADPRLQVALDKLEGDSRLQLGHAFRIGLNGDVDLVEPYKGIVANPFRAIDEMEKCYDLPAGGDWAKWIDCAIRSAERRGQKRGLRQAKGVREAVVLSRRAEERGRQKGRQEAVQIAQELASEHRALHPEISRACRLIVSAIRARFGTGRRSNTGRRP